MYIYEKNLKFSGIFVLFEKSRNSHKILLRVEEFFKNCFFDHFVYIVSGQQFAIEA